MVRRALSPRALLRSLRVWPFIVLGLAVMSVMLLVADNARREADRARKAQVAYEHLRARSIAISALMGKGLREVLIHRRPAARALPAIIADGIRVYGEMNRALNVATENAPGPRNEAIQRRVRELYDIGTRALGQVERSLAAATRMTEGEFEPALRRLDREIEAARRSQEAVANAANDRARRSLYVSLGGGVLALVSLTLLLERSRRRSRIEAEVREVERRSEERIRALVERSSDVVTILDPKDRRIIWQAPSIRRMLGYDATDSLGRQVDEAVHPDDLLRVQRGLMRCSSGGGHQMIACRMRHADGTWVHVEAQVEDRTDDPAVQGLLLSLRDVGERKALEERLRYQSFHDPLTGLANRVQLRERLAEALQQAAEGDHKVAVVFVDLDDFKTINDSLGHAVGDTVLRTAANRISGALGAGELASRQGGDEFVILIPRVDGEDAALATARRIHNALSPEFVVDDRELALTASIGVALDDGSTPPDEMLRNAEIAMYAAKEEGKAGIRVFEEALHRRVMDRLELGAEMPQAIENGQFFLEYQPIVELATGRIVGMEALVRWQHPVRGRIPPYQFISLAEETGAIHPLGMWVLREACRQFAELRERSSGRDHLYVSVNVSTKQLRDPDFSDRVAEVLEETGLPASALVLELTESLLVDDREEIMVQLERLKALGLRLAVDDFGTGYSVLSYLQEFPLDLVKIDKSFVDDIHIAPDKAKLVAGIVQLSDSLKLKVVAEGIEEQAQAERLREIRSPLGQGYLFSRPVPLEQVEDLLAQGASAAAA